MRRLWPLALALAASAQSPNTGGIRGQVLDVSGATMAGATIEVSNPDTGLHRSATSDGGGRYSFGELPLTGRYRIRFSHAGFAAQERAELRLRSGESTTIDARLSPSAEHETVTVSGAAGGIQTDSAQLAVTLDPDRIEDTPVLGRKVTALPMLDASVRTAKGTGDLFLNNFLFVVDGAGRRQTSYVIDGGTGDDAWGRQTIFTNLPLGAIEEFTILTGSLSAAYGRTAGGVVNLNTRAGTNDFHGDFDFMLRPPGIEARNPVAARRTADKMVQGDGLLSGPLVRNKTFLLVSGEETRGNRDSTVTSPLAPQNYRGDCDDGLFLARLDRNFSPRNSAALRLNMDRMSDTNPQDAVGGITLPSAGRLFRRNTYAAQLSDLATLSPWLLNEARAVFQVGSPITDFTPVSPSVQFTRPGLATEGESRTARLQNHQYQLADTVSAARGAHNLKFGGDAIYSTSGGFGTEFGSGYLLGQFTVKPGVTAPVGQLTIADVNRFTQSFGNPSYRVGEWLGSAFAEDAWRARGNFTLTLGLRYERQSIADGGLNFAPRLGFAWQPFHDGKTVVRGSAGVFYSQLRANLQAGFSLNGPEGVFNLTASPGQLGFPSSLAPLPVFPAGAVLPPRDITVRPGERAYLSRFFDVAQLPDYPDQLLEPRTVHVSLGVQRELGGGWILSADGVHQITSRIDRPLDLNAPAPFLRTSAGQTRSGAAADATRPIAPVNGGYRRIIATVNDGLSRYDGLQVHLRRRFGQRFTVDAGYTYSHTINTVEPDGTQQDPNDANFLGRAERADSLLDQRHRAVLSGTWRLPGSLMVGTVTQLASRRPYNITTGVDNNGDNSTADRPVVNGGLPGRNAGRGTPTYDVGSYAQRVFAAGERLRFTVRAEAFNLLNHPNIYGRNATWGNGNAPVAAFGTPLGGISNVDPGRQFQFLLRVNF
ncbi:MAG: carboxypeptidase regulatory-like domain-containing protein [Acidobacteriia bacterium]|nr:carboxypeptidase regulatory-like domain-containing protein [Terriglobia bacterium]